MNPEVKQLWVDALRSGEYEQGRECLREENTWCCIGVICDLHSNATGKNWIGSNYDGCQYYMPKCVQDWAGLSSENPKVEYQDNLKTLAALNDGDGLDRRATFLEIANLIETQL